MKWRRDTPDNDQEVIVKTSKGTITVGTFIKSPSLPPPKPGQKLPLPRPDRWVSGGKNLKDDVVGWIPMPEEG